MHVKRKTVFSQLQPNISLQESPILTAEHCDSDCSPEPYFYPTSYQPKLPRHMNLKVTVTNLLVQLKEWLIELCLSESHIAEIGEQLDPIIEELIDSGSHNSSSSWIETFNVNTNQPSLKQNSNVCIDSFEGHNRFVSVLQTDDKTEIALLGQNDRKLLHFYFKKYSRLFQNCLNRIHRFSGQKKLKFLVDTATKNIFSQTLRVSYDLKLIEHRLQQQKDIKLTLCRNGYIYLLAGRVSAVLREHGGLDFAFRRLKKQYYDGSRRDHVFVRSMMANVSKLCHLFERNKRNAINQYFYKWRISSLEAKNYQEESLVQIARSLMRDLLPCLAPGEELETFRATWRCQFQNQINLMIDSLFAGQECLFISLETLMRARRLEPRMSLVQLLEEHQQLCMTQRSFKEHQFLNQFRVEELQNCILTGQIYKSDRNDTSLLLVPIKPIKGIIFASLQKSHHNSLSFNKCPMTMKSFRTLLRIVELVTPLLEDVAELSNKVEEEWEETQQKSHYGLLFREFVKNGLSLGRNDRGYLQICEKDEEGVQIDSHRLETPTAVFASVMENLSISTLMVYHVNSSHQIKETPCVVLGDCELPKIQKHIIRSLFSELISSGKEMLTITRNGRSFILFPLREGGEIEGLVHCLLTQEGRENHGEMDYEVVVDALVPLIMRHEGAMECQICNVEVNLPERQGAEHQVAEDTSAEVILSDALSLITAQNMQQLTQKLTTLLQHKGSFFSQSIFKLNLSDPSTYFYLSQNRLNYLTLPPQQQIKHSDIYIEQAASMNSAGTLSKLAQGFPCFQMSELHVYENENSRSFRVIGVPIKKEGSIFGYWLVGHYLLDSPKDNEKIIEWIKQIEKYIVLNRLFKGRKINDSTLQRDLKTQSESEVQRQREIINDIRSIERKGSLLQQIQKLRVVIGRNFKSVKQYLVRSTPQDKLVQVKSHSSSSVDDKAVRLDSSQIDFLKAQPIRYSHQKIISQTCRLNQTSQHRTIRPLKYQKLHGIQLFLPELPRRLKCELVQKLKQEYQLQGWNECQTSELLTQIASKIGSGVQDEQRYVTVLNAGLFPKGHYFLMLQGSLEDEESKMLTEAVVVEAQYQLQNILQTCLSALPNQHQKTVSIASLNSMIQNGRTKRYCISKFRQNFTRMRSKIIKFEEILTKVLIVQSQKQIGYLKMLQKGIGALKRYSESVERRYSLLSVAVAEIVTKAEEKSCYWMGFRGIEDSIREPCKFGQIRGSFKFITTLSNIAIKRINIPFTIVSQHSSFSSQQTKLSKTLSLQKLQASFARIHMNSGQLHFWNQISKLSGAFLMNFRLIGQQFSKMVFRSREWFLRFANERFKRVIEHLDYGMTQRVDIMCGFGVATGKMIYKLNSQDLLEELYTIESEEHILADRGILQIPVHTALGSNHYLYIKISTKNGIASPKEHQILAGVIEEGLLPCYSQYVCKMEDKTNKVSRLLSRISCKELWNGSCSQAQKLYAFGPDKCHQHQCHKLRFINKLKSLANSHIICQTKRISSNINSESKFLYTLSYEYNSLSSLLAGSNLDSSLYQNIVHKYGEVITRDKLAQMREELEKLEVEEQKKSLQYQIKSKTFATSQIITFLEKRANNQVEGVSHQFLVGYNKENIRGNKASAGLAVTERAYVQKKLELGELKEKVKLEHRKQKVMASRAIWLILSQLAKKTSKASAKTMFTRMLLPRGGRYRT